MRLRPCQSSSGEQPWSSESQAADGDWRAFRCVPHQYGCIASSPHAAKSTHYVIILTANRYCAATAEHACLQERESSQVSSPRKSRRVWRVNQI